MIKKLLFAIALATMTAEATYAQEIEDIEIDGDFEEEGDMVAAPEFKLKDLQGKEINISDYIGDWVVIDFWGSWCRYCIQGIPDMKEAYAKYHPLGLEIIGIDCGDSDEDWRAAVAKYQLPWMNVYNPEDKTSGVLAEYAVQGFPTKVVVNPEGYIYEVFLGEDPEFYNFLKLIYE